MKDKTIKAFRYLMETVSLLLLVATGHYATVYFDGNYQAGSKSKIDECERTLNVYRCVLVAVEDERN